MERITTIKKTAKWKKRKLLLFGLLTIFILLIIFEIVFRVIFYFSNKEYHTTVYVQGSPLQESDDTLIFKNRPFYLDYHKKYQNNEEGMKSAPGDVYIPVKKSNDFWVLLTGASAMEGMGSNRNGDWLSITGVDDHPYNETIAFYLQQLLQQAMPGKKVKVFNAAFSSSIIYQSYQRYLQLSNKIDPDWVISMDGQNDPAILAAHETSIDYIKNEWRKNPQYHSPLKYIIAFTQHSAFINAIKQKLFDLKQDAKAYNARKNGFPLRTQWATTPAPPIQLSADDEDIKRAVDHFSMWELKYDSILNIAHRKHLLLLQPHMFLRDTTHLDITELAVNHYYRSVFQDAKQNTFLSEIYKRFIADSLHKNIVPMLSVHNWTEPVFVDYCHFTDQATKKIAAEIYTYIISNGKAIIFKSNSN